MRPFPFNRSVVIVAVLVVLWRLLAGINQTGDLSHVLLDWHDVLLFLVPSFVIGLTIHEFCHAFVADLAGDPTPRQLGRLTLNPLKHLDPLGAAMIFVVGFGWANPVPINASYFRHPKRDMAFAAAAGPLSNLLLAALAIVLIDLVIPLEARDPLLAHSVGWAQREGLLFLRTMAQINALLGVFNLIPVAPLDGHYFLRVILSPRAYFAYKQREQTIAVVALAILLMHGFDPLFEALRQTVDSLIVVSYFPVR